MGPNRSFSRDKGQRNGVCRRCSLLVFNIWASLGNMDPRWSTRRIICLIYLLDRNAFSACRSYVTWPWLGLLKRSCSQLSFTQQLFLLPPPSPQCLATRSTWVARRRAHTRSDAVVTGLWHRFVDRQAEAWGLLHVCLRRALPLHGRQTHWSPSLASAESANDHRLSWIVSLWHYPPRIQQIDQHVKTGTAVVTFEKSSAAKTALMVGSISAYSSIPYLIRCAAQRWCPRRRNIVCHLRRSAGGGRSGGCHSASWSDPQASRRKWAIFPAQLLPSSWPRMFLVAAEYLAKGYKLSDSILQRAIELDREFCASPFSSLV